MSAVGGGGGGGPRLRPLNVSSDLENRPTANNKNKSTKPLLKPQSQPKTDKTLKPTTPQAAVETKDKADPSPQSTPTNLLPSILSHQGSLNASCSSEASASSGSSSSRSSIGRVVPRRNTRISFQGKRQCGSKPNKRADDESVHADSSSDTRRRCAWVTANIDPCYAAFHDEEWGVPVHDDRKLFELLTLSGALAEVTWPILLNKRHIFREVFLDFDPAAVSKLSEKRIATPGSLASSLLSEPKLRAIIENAHLICKIINEFGSFDSYIWSFVNNKPIVNQFKYPRQIPIKSAKADAISKDMVRRGFRSVSPTVIYSFMQAVGLTNDHLTSCFRFPECIAAADPAGKNDALSSNAETKDSEDTTGLGLPRAMRDLTITLDR